MIKRTLLITILLCLVCGVAFSGSITSRKVFDVSGTNIIPKNGYELSIDSITPVIFASRNTGSAQTMGTADVEITWDTDDRKDTDYTHTEGSADITIYSAGNYIISYGVGLLNNTYTNRINWHAWVEDDDTKINGSDSYGYSRDDSYVKYASCSKSFYCAIEAESVINVHIEISTNDTTFGDTTANANTISGEGTILIEKVD